MKNALEWANKAKDGDYLIFWADNFDEPDSVIGLNGGYDDLTLDQVRSILRGRGLNLSTDDRGILASK